MSVFIIIKVFAIVNMYLHIQTNRISSTACLIKKHLSRTESNCAGQMPICIILLGP